MKRALVFILCFILLFLMVVPCFAHSGGTDGKGGHYDHSTGGYHYHHGKPAHQHPNGECPYANINAERQEDGEPVWLIVLIIAVLIVCIFIRFFS